ncbi:MAG: 6,7-dimethyl-8-ribityllumazine synthase [bacterium]|nr:6,7-dimethyl-8-ribityllumazine synthase [bacterium]
MANPTTIEGMLTASGLRLGIVVSRFNEFITGRLLEGALDCWRRHGGDEGAVTIVWVPGAWELPAAAKRLAEVQVCDAIVCLGAVIRGGTPHFEYVASETAKGIAAVGMESNVPVIFGVLTTDTVEQAIERAGTKAGNKGWHAVLAAMEMAHVYRALPRAGAGS